MHGAIYRAKAAQHVSLCVARQCNVFGVTKNLKVLGVTNEVLAVRISIIEIIHVFTVYTALFSDVLALGKISKQSTGYLI